MGKIQELEKLISHQKHNEREMKVEIGEERFNHLNQAIRSEMVKAGLNDIQAHHLLTHLSDTFRLERMSV
ncbi:hypothetical protein D3C74_43520 [compost metagenome]